VVRFDREASVSLGYGGTLVALKNAFFTRKARLSSDYGVLKIIIQNYSLWIVNVYLSRGSKTQIQELFMNIHSYLSTDDMKFLIVIGDFNVKPWRK